LGLDTVETILWAENEFGIEIPDADASEIRTVGEFSFYIHRTLALRDGLKAPTEGEVFEGVKKYLVSYFMMKPEWITREAEFIKDLGME
jgi:acyl carrier protein